jgi:hypothetical protein
MEITRYLNHPLRSSLSMMGPLIQAQPTKMKKMETVQLENWLRVFSVHRLTHLRNLLNIKKYVPLIEKKTPNCSKA